MLPVGRERIELPKGRCLRRPVCARNLKDSGRDWVFSHQLLVDPLLPSGKAHSTDSTGYALEVLVPK